MVVVSLMLVWFATFALGFDMMIIVGECHFVCCFCLLYGFVLVVLL